MPGLEITDPFDEPYLGGTTGSSLSSSFSPAVVGIAGIPYLIDDASGYKRESFDVVQQRNTTDARDLLLLPQDVWRWQEQSWHLGAGQSNLDRDDSLQYRYEDSYGIDPWTRYQISLLPQTERLYLSDTMSGSSWLTTYGNYLAVVNDDTIYWYDELSAGSTAFVGSTVVEADNPVIDIANSALSVTTLHQDGKVYETKGPGVSPSLKGTYPDANMIAYQKDFLICGKENRLYDITAGGAGTLVYTHPVTAFRWNSAADGNSCIYVLGGVQDKYVVHRIGIKDDGTGLSPAIVAATLPDGEYGYVVDSYLGFVFVGTDKGVRMAQQNNNAGDLTLGPVIPAAAPVRCFEGQDRFVWYGLSSLGAAYAGQDDDIFPAHPVPGLGRMDLSNTTTTQLTPAYANDVCVPSLTASPVRSVLTFAQKRVFTVDGAGIWFESTKAMTAGWLTEGIVSFSIEDLKTGLYIQSKWLPLQNGASITEEISYDSSAFSPIVDLAIPDSIRSGNISLSGTQFSRANARHVLRSDTVSGIGPYYTRWEIRAIPVKNRTSRWTLPILNREEVEIDTVIYTRDPQAVVNTLVSLVENSTLFTLQEAGRSYQVHAKDYAWQPESLTTNGRAWQGTFTLVVEEVQ